MADTITLKAKCHCGDASYTYELPKSAFPLKSAICHCNSCRHVSGHIFTTHVVIPVEERPDVSKLTGYASSQGLTRYFCPRCGATMINFEAEEWEFATGVLSGEGKPEAGGLAGLLDRVQLWVSDAVDGGGNVTDEMLRDMASKSDDTVTTTTDDTLRAYCHCGSIQIAVERPIDGGKYGAGIDACTSCRKVSGFEYTSWITLDPSRISINRKNLDLETQNLSHYNTSSDVHRYFCRICGGTIFYLKDGKVENRGIDLGAGLIASVSGVRAEEWLDWSKYNDFVAYKEDASDGKFVQCLADGVAESRRNHAKE